MQREGLKEGGYRQILTQVVSNTRQLHKPSSTAAVLGKERSREGQMLGQANKKKLGQKEGTKSLSPGTVLAE